MHEQTKSAVEECIDRLKTNIYEGVLSQISSQEKRKQFKLWIRSRLDPFLTSSKNYSEEEFQLVLMWFYIQLKTEWSQLNTHAQYKQMDGYMAPKSLIIKLRLLSVTIKEIENFINIYHVDGVTSFLSLPMIEFERAPTMRY